MVSKFNGPCVILWTYVANVVRIDAILHLVGLLLLQVPEIDVEQIRPSGLIIQPADVSIQVLTKRWHLLTFLGRGLRHWSSTLQRISQ